MDDIYLQSVQKQFTYYKIIAEKAIEQVDDSRLFVTLDNNTNSIAIIMQHMAGNMVSRWTDFLNTDGEKEWRNRDAEFEPIIQDKKVLLEYWDKGWNCLFEALNSLSSQQLYSIIYIRNEGHTVLEAINRQLAHYPYHIGQIVFLSKILNEGSWKSLSIPKNSSLSYNSEKFSKEKTISNFVDAELKKLKNG